MLQSLIGMVHFFYIQVKVLRNFNKSELKPSKSKHKFQPINNS